MPTINELNTLRNKIEEEESRIKNLEKSLNDKIVLGLDLSKSCPGVAIISTETKKLLYVDSFKASGSLSFYGRNLEISTWLEKIINIYRPKTVILESAFMSKFGAKSNVTLLRLHGYIGHILYEKGLTLKLVTPSSSRAFLKIKPNDKKTAFEWVKKNFPEADLTTFTKDNDKSDAIILALSIFNKEKLKEY